jgi:hypothetical protein
MAGGGAVSELRESLREVIFKAAGGVSGMGDVEIDAVLDAVYNALPKPLSFNRVDTPEGNAEVRAFNTGLRSAVTVIEQARRYRS